MIGRFDGEDADERVPHTHRDASRRPRGLPRLPIAGYFTPHSILVADATCSKSVALAYPSLDPVTIPRIGDCT
jgi:hypothetical protein